MMMSTSFARTILRSLIGGSALCVALSMSSVAQVKTQTTEAHGQPTKEVEIERGEIAYINGNTVIIRMEDGSLRHFDNVPDSVNFMVDGKPVNIHNARVGMKLQKETIRTTTDKVVTTVETVTGKVWHVAPPHSVTLTLENGENQQFKIPEGQKFMINGQETDAWGLRKGMRVSVQRVTEVPVTVMAHEVHRTGVAPPAPPVKEEVPILVVVARPAPPSAPVETTAEATPARLPTTASNLPLIGLLGMLFCGLSLITIAIRRIVS